MMLMAKLLEKDKLQHQFRQFFMAADSSGDGFITIAELEEILQQPLVEAWLDVLELEAHEVEGLVRMLDDNADGKVSMQEFVDGAMRLKGSARGIDAIAILHGQAKLASQINQVAAHVQHFYGKLQQRTCVTGLSTQPQSGRKVVQI
eukprot:gnl/TRDRNA2_/TRDRNA2_79596_c2_seq1.p1 gnl/TRDRNA2_/TRDRNA2_79596_c2~~gnl/TRDRNA2_/TRDRNA2_79596_c2_seq1.p1  ORF type:complete len:147 (-),score=31.77 gnl/TRDRNA2_/TRDRNA2_79596_c2_seq1:70-510(-)